MIVGLDILSAKECIKRGRYPRIDEFCAATKNASSLIKEVAMGGYILCNGILMGILTGW